MEILEALGNIGFDWRITVANIINFAIVYFVLKKLVFEKLDNVLSDRRRLIEDGLQNATDAAELKEKASTERDQILRDARLEATEIVSNARQKEADTIESMGAKAEKEAQTIINDAKQKAAAEHATMLGKFKTDAAELVVAAAEKLLQDEITNDAKKDVAKRYLNQVETQTTK